MHKLQEWNIHWLLNPMSSPFILLWKYRSLIWATVRNDLQSRVINSILGLAWIAVYPLLLLLVYAIVYFNVYHRIARPEVLGIQMASLSSVEYIVFIFCGLIPFLSFTESITAGVTSLTNNAHLIKNTLFPVELVPVKTVLVAQFTQGVCMSLLLLAIIAIGSISPYVLWILPVWLCQVLFLLGLVWFLSCINIVLRDCQHLMSILLLCLMLISPIAIPMDELPAICRILNPLNYIILCLRDCVLFAQPPKLENLITLGLMSGIMFYVGYWMITQTKILLSDNL
jgi:lipopolysaccharide transport system permease protein